MRSKINALGQSNTIKLLINDQDQSEDIQNTNSKESMNESNDESQNFHIKTSLPNLPPIQNQEPYEDYSTNLFSQQIQDVENEINDIIMEDKNNNWKKSTEDNINKITNYITPMKISSNKQQVKEGEMTPKAGTKATPINIIQEKLKNALKVLSPQEKMDKIRQKAKDNAMKMKRMTLESTKVKESQVKNGTVSKMKTSTKKKTRTKERK